MDDVFRTLNVFRTFSAESVRAVVDILVVSYVVYRLLALIRGPRAWRILGGVIVFVVLLLASAAIGLHTLHWVMDKATILGPVALVILLLPEMRQALEGFGKLGFWPQRAPTEPVHVMEARTVEEIVAASAEMASTRTGALIVIERGSPLDDIIANGVPIDSTVSAPLLGSIFFGSNPLHDGAAVVRGDRIVAAACRLPLSDNVRLASNLHMRHRAAVGVTEQVDCVTIVISEERGTIGVAIDGQIRQMTAPELREELNRELRGVDRGTGRTIRRLRSRSPKEKQVETRVS